MDHNFYENLSLQIERASIASYPILMVGDFNAELGNGTIKGDNHNMSSNGQKLHNLIIKYNLNVVNSMGICSGSFTRANKIVAEKSVLDYVIVSDELIRYIKNMKIDTAKQFTPWCTLKSGKRFSDHNAIIPKVEYSKIPSQSKSDRETVWNFNHPKGWEKFRKFKSTNNSLSDCWNDISGVETSYEKWSD